MRKRVLILAAIAAMPLVTRAQYLWDIGFGVGAANYLGEMGGKELTRRDFVADMKLSQTRSSENIFVRYRFNQYLSLKANISHATIRGADSLSTNLGRLGRNLNFRNNLFEANAECQFFFYEVNDLGRTYRYKDNFRAFVGIGAGAVYHNPQAFYQGEWINLRPLMTEGYNYKKVVLVIPATAGFYFTINKRHRIGWNLNWRTTFSDYLDDVSTVYVDPSQMADDPMASILANRTDELAPGVIPPHQYGSYGVWPDGRVNKRGDVTHKDSYLTTNVEYSYVLRGKSSIYRSKYGSIFKGKKYKRRKVRAKF